MRNYDSRAVIYCRCSTEEESQKNALRQQVREAKECVAGMNWIMVREYVESKSGTSVSGRSAYQQLYHDLQSDLFDIVVIKSIDRLMRNVKDWYLFLERLTQNGKRLYLYLDRKYYKPEDNLIVGIKAILAEEYSRELSKKINNAHRHRQKKGTSVSVNSRTWGYQKTADKSVIIDEQERPIIERIFQLAGLGYGGDRISNILFEEGVRNRNGRKLGDTSIRRIIRNPIYKGQAVMNRMHYDFDLKRTVKLPENEWICHVGLVPPIVTEEMWEKANRQMDSHLSEIKSVKENGPGKQPGVEEVAGKNRSRSVLTGKLICGLCGAVYYRTTRKNKHADIYEKRIVEWKCHTYLQYGRKGSGYRKDRLRSPEQLTSDRGCDNIHLPESYVFNVLLEFLKSRAQVDEENRENLIEAAMEILAEVIDSDRSGKLQESLVKEKEIIRHKKSLLLDKLLDGVINDIDYQSKSRELDIEEKKIDKQLSDTKKVHSRHIETRKRLAAIRDHIASTGIDRAAVEEVLYEVDRVVVYPDHLSVKFGQIFVDNPVSNSQKLLTGQDSPEDDKTSTIVIPVVDQGLKGKSLKIRQEIMQCMKDDPTITAKKIAEKTGLGISCVQYQIRELRARGYIRFSGKGGSGIWEVKEVIK